MNKKLILFPLVLSLVFLIASCGSQKSASNSSGSGATTASVSSAKVNVQTVLANLDKAKFKEGELLVKFRSGAAASVSAKAHSAVGGSVKRMIRSLGVEQVSLPGGMTVRAGIEKYMQDPDVEYAEPNYILHTHFIPNDQYFWPHQWALLNTGLFRDGTKDADMKAHMAWDINTGTKNVTIAVVDTGIDSSHPDLFNNVVPGRNTVANPDNNFTMDDFGHGTHVAGIIGAVGNNSLGVAGVMWNVRLMPVKVCGADGDCLISDIAGGVTFAVDNGADILNMSLGTFPPGAANPITLQNAISYANSFGVLVIASAGNESNNNDILPVYPASYSFPNVIAVGATDQNDRLVEFSNFGSSVHVAAPGANILNTMGPNLVAGLCTASEFPGYDYCDGTSMAAPHVAGLAGLIYSYYPHFTYTQVKETILRYVDRAHPSLNTIHTGGRINAYRSVSSLLTPTGLTAGSSSSSGITLAWSDNATGEDGYKIERSMDGVVFTEIASIGPNSASFSDSGLSASTTYTYRVRAFNTIPANSAYSGTAAATTQAAPVAAPATSSGGGGGGCSIGAKQNMPTAVADLALVLVPLVVIAILRRKR